MPLKDTTKVDVIVKSPHTGGYDLIVVDSGDVSDEIERYNLLLEKLKCYSSFVLSGQLKKSNPESEGKEIRFCVVCQVPPNAAMLQLQALKPSDNSSERFSVLITTQDGYLTNTAYENISKEAVVHGKKKWWKIW